MYIDLLVAEGVAGVVISPTSEADTACLRLLESGIPLVTVDRRLLQVSCPSVLVDNAAAAGALVDHLVADGHVRIAGLFGLLTMTTGRERYEGYAAALQAHGLPVLPELVRCGLPTEAAGYAFTRELLASGAPPSALLGGNNLLTMGALRAIRERGLRIPQDIGVVSFDVVPWMPLFEPPLTAIAMPTYEMGRTAAEVLLRAIAGEPDLAREYVLQATLQLGQSCHPHLPADGLGHAHRRSIPA
jgi:DNA-binding LacI/PurR family transcriptional regulator